MLTGYKRNIAHGTAQCHFPASDPIRCQHQSAMYVKSLKRVCSSSVRCLGSLGGVNCGFSDVNSTSKLLTSSTEC